MYRDLVLLNAHYKHDVEHKNPINEFRYEASMIGVQRELNEKFTAQTKACLLSSDQVLMMINLYLAKPFLGEIHQRVA